MYASSYDSPVMGKQRILAEPSLYVPTLRRGRELGGTTSGAGGIGITEGEAKSFLLSRFANGISPISTGTKEVGSG